MDKSGQYISVLCIIGSEFWERFSFCGLRTILSLYLRNELLLSENSATIVYHVFIMMCYIVPILGATCADSLLGRYHTILYFSLVYVLGNVFMIFAAFPPIEFNPILSTILGLTLIAIGTGGTKPCVAAFGGDQFHLPTQQNRLQQFFSLFYFAINLGGFIGMILTPILRKAVTCFGDETCYALGFGFPALLMVLSTVVFFQVLFILGKPWYRMKKPKSNVVTEFVCCSMYALTQRMKARQRFDHWLDYAKGRYNSKLIQEMKIVYAVLWLYAPLPLFWSLFDQQGSRWTFQASRMDGFLWGMQIVPDQMQVINPALVLVLIPFFDKLLYPLLRKRNCLTNHLHRMAVGGLVAGLAFIFAGVLELVLEQNYPKLPGRAHASVNVINTSPCTLNVLNPFQNKLVLNASGRFQFADVPAVDEQSYDITVIAPAVCGGFELTRRHFALNIIAMENHVDTIILAINENNAIDAYITEPIEFKKSLSGKPRISILFLKRTTWLSNVSVSLRGHVLIDTYYLPNSESTLLESDYIELPPGPYEYRVHAQNLQSKEGHVHLALGGIYTLIIGERNTFIEFGSMYTMSPPNKVNIMWLIPQYVLISVAELMFGIAGLEFAFTQAPSSMKTVTIAVWYLSVAIGNLMVIVVAQANIFRSQAHEFFMFAILIVGDMMIFVTMSEAYHFVELEADSSTYVMPEHRPLMTLHRLGSHRKRSAFENVYFASGTNAEAEVEDNSSDDGSLQIVLARKLSGVYSFN